MPTICPAPAFYSSVEFVAGHAWAIRKCDAAFERVQALEAISVRNRFEGLLQRHEARLRGVVFAMLADPARVDDVLQEAFIRAYRKLPSRFDSERHEAAWLYRIVYRCCLDEIRKNRRRPELPGLPETEPARTLEEPLAAIAVASALAELSPEQRAVVLLVDLIGLDYHTAASALRVPRGTVAWRLSVARSRLRVALLDSERGVPDA